MPHARARAHTHTHTHTPSDGYGASEPSIDHGLRRHHPCRETGAYTHTHATRSRTCTCVRATNPHIARTHSCTHTRARASTHTQLWSVEVPSVPEARTNAHTRAHTHAHTHTHTHTHTRARARAQPSTGDSLDIVSAFQSFGAYVYDKITEEERLEITRYSWCVFACVCVYACTIRSLNRSVSRSHAAAGACQGRNNIRDGSSYLPNQVIMTRTASLTST